MNKYGFEKGDLLRWTDYTATDDTHSPILRRQPKSFVGLFLGMRPAGLPREMNLAGDIIVLVGDKRVNWAGWQCDKLDKGEWTCK